MDWSDYEADGQLSRPVQILELFGGIGSPRCALRNLGIPTKAIDYVEIDEKAVKSYNAMFADELEYKTQSVVGWNLRPDILIHGSPCQDFSIAGKQKGADEGSETRSSLMWETIHIIQQMGEWKPRYVIWESVKNVLSKYMIHNFNRYLSEMSKMGYTNSFEVLNTMDFGLPQDRDRVFTVSILGNETFDFDGLIRTEMRDINEFLIDWNAFSEEEKRVYEVTQPSVYNVVGKKGIKRATVIKDCAKTITTRQDRTPAQVVKVGEQKYRYLTEKECWLLQGYADEDFYNAAKANPFIPGKMNRALYKQAGNSISVPIFESIFRKILLNQTREVGYKQLTLF
jgi:DNA (cytosine-5)-methyltransferase 1